MNPGGFSYSGYALCDCIKGIPLPVIEVHLTNQPLQPHSVSAAAARGVLVGLGVQTYFRAVDAALDILNESDGKAA